MRPGHSGNLTAVKDRQARTPSRRTLLRGVGGSAAAVSVASALGGCSSDSDSSSGSAEGDGAPTTRLETSPLELSAPAGWDYPALEAATLPFVHGVASGDPTDDAVILWTRLTIPDESQLEESRIEVAWEVASDDAFAEVVSDGSATTDESYDWTVKIDVGGLQPGSTYWYRFSALGHTSPSGRTVTARKLGADPLQIAAVSCASYWSGYFNAFRRIADRDDVALVLHAGDHIYDEPDPEEWVRARNEHFDTENVDFRRWRTAEENGRRYALYYSDPDVAALRAAHPMVVAWDNHDIARDDATMGPDVPKEVFWLWTASRPPVADTVDGQIVATDPRRGHRRITYGDIDLFVLDVRSHSDDRSILGADQADWLMEGLVESASAGMARRLILSPLPVGRFEAAGQAVYGGWSEIQGDRDRLLATLEENDIHNNVFVSGDAHGAFIWDLPREQTADRYDPATGSGSVGVELSCNSVSRGGSDETAAGLAYASKFGHDAEADRESFEPLLAEAGRGDAVAAGLVSANASMHYANWTDHGYGMVIVDAAGSTLESWIVPHIEPSDEESLDARFVVKLDTDHVVRS